MRLTRNGHTCFFALRSLGCPLRMLYHVITVVGIIASWEEQQQISVMAPQFAPLMPDLGCRQLRFLCMVFGSSTFVDGYSRLKWSVDEMVI